MKQQILQITDFPQLLQQIVSPPKQLWYIGHDLQYLESRPHLGVVGSRAITPYGKAVIKQLLPDVIAHGVVIVSGLALGADAAAHRIALDNGGTTIAVLPSSLQQIYPATNRQLAEAIVASRGTLISEYPEGSDARREHFIARNRIVSGLSKAVLIIEAAEKSGTLHTANFALEQGRDVLVVPGNITAPQSVGTNNLIKAGARLVTSAQDILDALGIQTAISRQISGDTPEESVLIALIQKGITDGTTLLQQSQLSAVVFGQTMTMLELKGVISPLGADNWSLTSSS